MTDLKKRESIMRKSQKLGHCICNPKLPCPCPVFVEKDICHCAGEKAPAVAGVKLTSLSEYAGCASKVSRRDLHEVLAGLPAYPDPRVLVGTATADDAGVVRLTEDIALVQTVDVFTPTVDDAYTFGRIAAANSLSDVWAMGGEPLCALSIIGFPTDTLPLAVMRDILRGGCDAMRDAGVPVVGGHSIRDREVKFGFAVTGTVHPRKIVTNAGAQVGDAFILTKPLGTGVINFAAQLARAGEASVAAATAAMTALNREAAALMRKHGAHAATDVTGFGLLGHLSELAKQSKVAISIDASAVPALPGVLDLLQAGVASGALERNRESLGAQVEIAPGVPPAAVDLLLDPQTSGGLLIALAADSARAMVADLHATGFTAAAIIGQATGRDDRGGITISAREPVHSTATAPPEPGPCCSSAPAAKPSSSCCCAHPPAD